MIDISNYTFTDSKDKFQDKNSRFYLVYGEDYAYQRESYLLIFNDKKEHIGAANLGKYTNTITVFEDLARITKINYDELREDKLLEEFVKYVVIAGGGRL